MAFTRFDIDYYYPIRVRAHDTTEITEKDIFYPYLIASSRCLSLPLCWVSLSSTKSFNLHKSHLRGRGQ
jgi:hypothetical protein